MTTDPMLILAPPKGSLWVEQYTGNIYQFHCRGAVEADGENLKKDDIVFILKEEKTGKLRVWLAERFYSLFDAVH